MDETIAQLDRHVEEGRSPVAPLLGEMCESESMKDQTSEKPDVDEPRLDEPRQTMLKPTVDDKGPDEGKVELIVEMSMRQAKTNQAPKSS